MAALARMQPRDGAPSSTSARRSRSSASRCSRPTAHQSSRAGGSSSPRGAELLHDGSQVRDVDGPPPGGEHAAVRVVQDRLRAPPPAGGADLPARGLCGPDRRGRAHGERERVVGHGTASSCSPAGRPRARQPLCRARAPGTSSSPDGRSSRTAPATSGTPRTMVRTTARTAPLTSRREGVARPASSARSRRRGSRSCVPASPSAPSVSRSSGDLAAPGAGEVAPPRARRAIARVRQPRAGRRPVRGSASSPTRWRPSPRQGRQLRRPSPSNREPREGLGDA